MITGWIVDEATAAAVKAGVAQALESRGLPQYIAATSMQIHSGEHAGKTLLPLSDDALKQKLRGGYTLTDFPETAQLIAMLGGLEARAQIDPADLIDPNAPSE